MISNNAAILQISRRYIGTETHFRGIRGTVLNRTRWPIKLPIPYNL